MPSPAYLPPGSLSPEAAAQIARRARRLLRRGELSQYSFTVLDALLWAGRKPGQDKVTAAYSHIQRIAHCCRATAVKAIKALVQLGLLRKQKKRDLVLWCNGGRRWRQLPNNYQFRCESTAQTEYPEKITTIRKIEANPAEARAAQAALTAIASSRERKLLMKFGSGDGSSLTITS
jgi:hypothetical protein